jgi:hypothetical protein
MILARKGRAEPSPTVLFDASRMVTPLAELPRAPVPSLLVPM